MSESQANSARNGAPSPASRQSLRSIDAVRLAKAYLQEFAGRSCEQVSGLEATDEGWAILLEVVELERIPNTTDILGSYLVTLDHEGELVGYERINRYYRSQVREQPNASGGES